MHQSTEDAIRTVSRISAVPSILEIVSETTGLRFAAIARVTDDSWTACAVLDKIGFGVTVGDQLEVSTTLCREICASRDPVVIEHASEDPAFCGHRTPKMYGFESYIAVPIVRRSGEVFGTICALDPRPAKLKEGKVLRMIELYAELVAAQLEIEDRLVVSQSALANAMEAEGLREQFIAVLGHDLRNPLFAIMAGIRGLLRRPSEEKAALILDQMQQSATRMSGLIDDILDFARAKLGGGIAADRRAVDNMGDALNQIVVELQSTHPERTIHSDIVIENPIHCDLRRVAQLFSNLLGNALTHGATDSPVLVKARDLDGSFELSVSNRGPRIAPETLARIFEPYSQPANGEQRAGLGLGLYIASQIAQSHGGSIAAESSPGEEITFTVRIPSAG